MLHNHSIRSVQLLLIKTANQISSETEQISCVANFQISRFANLNFETSNLTGKANPNFLAQNERLDFPHHCKNVFFGTVNTSICNPSAHLTI